MRAFDVAAGEREAELHLLALGEAEALGLRVATCDEAAGGREGDGLTDALLALDDAAALIEAVKEGPPDGLGAADRES